MDNDDDDLEGDDDDDDDDSVISDEEVNSLVPKNLKLITQDLVPKVY